MSSIPGCGTKIPYASWPKNQNTKYKQYCNKFNKDYKWSTLKRKKLKMFSEKDKLCLLLLEKDTRMTTSKTN